MKKYIYSLVIATLAMVGFTACSSDDNDYQKASVSGEQVYFSSELPAVVSTPVDANSFTIQLNRVMTDNEQTVPLTITLPENCIYTPAANQVTFAAGSKTADLVFNYDPTKVVYGKYVDITVEIADASLTTLYGASKFTFQAGMTEWKDMAGKATFNDDLICGLYGITTAWTVSIQESSVTPGRYRLVAPYGPATAFPSILYQNGLISGASSVDDVKNAYTDTDENTYMVINAQDPKAVWFEACETGYKDLGGGIAAGAVGVISYVDYYVKSGKYTVEEYKAKYPEDFGVLEDGVITFPTGKEILVTIDGALKYYGNTHKQFAIALPGHALKDFSADIEYLGIFTNPAGEAFASCNLTLGADATNVKAVVIEQDADDNAVADAIVAGELEAVDVQAGSIQVPVAADMSGKLKVVVVVIDNDTPKKVASVGFEYYGGGANPWKSLGVGYYTDDIICPLFGYDPEDFEVEIQESNDTPGVYRLVKGLSAVATAFGVAGGNDVIVNAEDPNAVYITPQDLGFDFGYGAMSLFTEAGYYVSEYGFAAVKAAIDAGQLEGVSFATLADGVITFPMHESENSKGDLVQYQIWLGMGESQYFGGRNGQFKIVLPTAAASVKAKAKKRAAAADFARRLHGNFAKSKAKMARKAFFLGKKVQNTKR
jgi:hypothetical protein